ncbi:hypothetical protein EI94DRAFT_1710699 [Lactarius quietus]|nr:hypothetical protein EI94DRAFT_1710699 [Lactarius quietus]
MGFQTDGLVNMNYPPPSLAGHNLQLWLMRLELGHVWREGLQPDLLVREDAAHIQKVICDQSPLYGGTPASAISNIDSIENSVFLTATAHILLGRGAVAFVKKERPRSYNPATTINEEHSWHGAFLSGVHMDAVFHTGTMLPPPIILNYIYGVATYNCWCSGQDGDIHDMMKNYYTEHYKNILAPTPSSLSGDGNTSKEPDNLNDSDYTPDDDSSSSRPGDAHSPNHPLPMGGAVALRGWYPIAVIFVGIGHAASLDGKLAFSIDKI